MGKGYNSNEEEGSGWKEVCVQEEGALTEGPASLGLATLVCLPDYLGSTRLISLRHRTTMLMNQLGNHCSRACPK